jgi:NAD(P)-dependent dehydrogenase (short-subunit alcohol dehydrogenase family)
LLKALAAGGYAVSVRAPQNAPSGAHALAQRFGGAGRARAAGIDVLPAERLDEFVAAFAAMRWGEG